MKKVESNMNNLQPLVSFLLGAAVATVLMSFYFSASPGGRKLEILAWGNGTDHDIASIDAVLVNNTKPVSTDEEELALLLRAAAMDNDTVIMTWVNDAWAAPDSLLDLFFESFHVGEQIEYLLKHLIIVAVDPKAFERCKTLHPHCYYLKMEGNFTSEKRFMTKDYLDLMWSRNRFQKKILELGYNFLFTDVDILWFRNPFRHMSVFAHITFASDGYIGNPDDLENLPNGGFLYVKSCKRTIDFYEDWYHARKKWTGMHEQNVLNKIKHEFSAKNQVKIQFIDTVFCGGFCSLSKDLNRIVTMHANCCIGLGNKLSDLRNILDDWKKYRAASDEEKRKGKISWRLPGKCVK